jgi:flagellar assembly protein FliH
MISRSENGREKTTDRDASLGLSVRLLAGGGREVSRLEFSALEEPETVAEVETDVPEVVLEEKVATLDEQLRSQAEQLSSELEIARREMRTEARGEWELELEKKISEERISVSKICEGLLHERTKYFAGVEAEIVKLALAIAARVLHREATLDPLLLTAVVRVALEKVTQDSATILRVPMSAVEMWREVFGGGSESSLQVVGDERLGVGECVLDTNVGRVELGVNAQLEEIERGFFDLMQRRPA